MPDSKESQAKRSSNAADLLSHFREKQARHDENHVEVSSVYEHLLEDISECPARFSFTRDEILDGIHEAWPHITEYIHDLDVSHSTLEKELDLEKTDNRRLRSELDTLDERIQELEAQLESLQPKPHTGDQSIMAASTTDISSSDVGTHPLSSPADRTYSHKHSRKLFENPSFQNREWHTNPMSVPNALRDDSEGYFLEEDIDVAVWISKVSADISRPAFMEQMKVVFGSRDSFDTAFSGFNRNLLGADHDAKISTKSQDTKPEKLPKGPDFLALVLEHCVLTRTQIYGRIIPYMIRHESKRPCTRAGSEHAAYMHLNQCPPAPHKGKRPMTGSLQSRLSTHALTPVKTGESSRQRLDTDLDNYNQVCDPVLPYEEEPPSGEPEAGDTVPQSVGANSTLHDESNMDIDPELDDIYS
ncbi:hypothetical protein M422DRAFT_257059 [Sphaerobolus stellatus SS14]|uniref:Uncharacterized protein n=1 Tax=Sphaerobolus stellatus (strain SS14) TaxID=990650 RepID=A0A0C9UYQ5_SPHS4|nr:hypothetical protein M422DRAFT_257059 [Sphaerobolus stellatus SS14]